MRHDHLKTRLALVSALLSATALTSGCWGGGDDDNNATAPTPAAATAVPASAGATTISFITYLGGLVNGAANDTGEPLDISAVTPAVDDTAEPFAIN